MHRTQKKKKPLCIGIVTNPSMHASVHGTSYISKKYVDWFEHYGIRVVPIPYDTPHVELYFSMINGLCIPGNIKGSVDNNATFIRTVTRLYKLSLKDAYFPIWGECFGFQLLMSIVGQCKTLKEYDATGTYPIHPTVDSKHSHLLQSFTPAYRHYIEHTTSTYHDHLYGISPEDFMKNARLRRFYHISATAFDDKGAEFVALIEAKKYPIYGLAFEPWGMKQSRPFLDFIRSELQKNRHRLQLMPYVHRVQKHHTYLHSPSERHRYYFF